MAEVEPEVVRAMRRFKAGLAARDEAMLRELARRYAQLERALEAQIEALAEEAARRAAAGEAISRWQVQRWGRYEKLLAQLQAETGRYVDDAVGVIATEQRAQVLLGLQQSSSLVWTLAPGAAGLFDVLPVQALEYLIGLVSDGSPLRAYLLKVYPQAAEAMMDALVQGMGQGWGAAKIAREMRRAATVSLRTAMNTARTETLRAYRAASLAQYQASGIIAGYKRLAAKSTRTCAACLMMDGQWFPLETPFAEHVNGRCLTPGTIVSGPGVVGFIARYYQGYVVTIRTAAGKLLTVTPNHPVLTKRGWVRAELLQEGDDVVGSDCAELSAAGVPDEHYMPTMIEEIPSALDMVRLPAVMPATAEDFHGDGEGSEVYIVWADRLLRDRFETALSQPRAQGGLGGRDVRGVGLASCGHMTAMGECLGPAASGFLGDGDASMMFFDGCALSQQTIGSGLVTAFDAGNGKASCNDISRDVIGAGQGIFGLAGQVARDEFFHRDRDFCSGCGSHFAYADSIASSLVSKEASGLQFGGESGIGDVESCSYVLGALAGHVSLDRVLEVSRGNFAGHVYNLQTADGWYSANGIITHNCTMVPTINGREASRSWTTGREWFEEQSPEVQKKILGPGLFQAWRDGKIGLEDVPVLHEDLVWGNSWQVARVPK